MFLSLTLHVSRYEALAVAGEPQAALNAAFCYRAAAEQGARGAGGGGRGGGRGGGVPRWATRFTLARRAAEGAAALLPPSLADALGLGAFCAAPSWGDGSGGSSDGGSSSGGGGRPISEAPAEPPAEAPAEAPADTRAASAVGSAAASEVRRRSWLERAVRLYEQAAAGGSLEALRELGHCHWGQAGGAWAGACAAGQGGAGPGAADSGGGGENVRGKGGREGGAATAGGDAGARKAAALFGAAAAGGDLQAMRALAHLRSGLGSALGAVPSAGAEGGGGGGVVDRVESRRLYAECAAAGGYPDGLPCQLEAVAAEVRWAAADLAAAAAAAWPWAREA